jgi:hypothetical protein
VLTEGLVSRRGEVLGHVSLAVYSSCERYRYLLERRGPIPGAGKGLCVWVMLNPSTATEAQDDPTIRKCRGFARRWGYADVAIVNLFAWRSTDPAALGRVEDPVGDFNDRAIRQALARTSKGCGLVVAAWGAHPAAATRAVHFARLLVESDAGQSVCLGVTQGGAPRHPLYVPYSAVPRRFL